MGLASSGEKPIRRVGEATNSGPTLKYARPETSVGFKGARQAATGDDGLAGYVDGPPKVDPFALQVITANCTGWGPLQRLPESTAAHAVLAQEHHLRGIDVAAASQGAKARGWKSLWAEAEPGTGEGTRGGVAVFVRDFLGLSRPHWGDHVLASGRVVAAMMEGPGCRPTLLVSAYFRDGEGLSAANRALMAAIGERLRELGHGAGDHESRASAAPYIVGADFNMLPDEVLDSGFADEVEGCVFAPRGARGTCRTAAAQRTLDFFVVSNGLGKAIAAIDTVEDGTLSTHVPVRIQFHPRLTALKALAIRAPPLIPTERVYGPIAPPPDWSVVTALCERARDSIRRATRQQAQQLVDAAYTAWAQMAELELQDVTGKWVDKPGLRGGAPALAWKSLIPEKVRRPRETKAAGWRQADSVMREISLAASALRAERGATAQGVLHEVIELLNDKCGAASTDDDGGTTGDELPTLDDDDLGPMDAATWQTLRSLARRARDLLTSVPEGGGDEEWRILQDRISQWQERIAEHRKKAETEERKNASSEWRDWVREGIDAGAKHAHKAVKLPELWNPTV